MAIITKDKFELRHILTIDATTEPSITQFTEWIAWAENKILGYLQCGDTLPTDVGDILENVSDDLLIQKWHYEKLVKKTSGPVELMKIMPPELSLENKKLLDNLKGSSATTEVPGFNFDIDTTSGGFD